MQSIYIGAIALCISLTSPFVPNTGAGLGSYQETYKTIEEYHHASESPKSFPQTQDASEVSVFDVEALTVRDKIRVSWRVTGEENNGVYTVERSNNGVAFTTLESFSARGVEDYSVMDNRPLNGNNFYRVAFSTKEGRTVYSKTIVSAFTSKDSFKSYYGYDGRIMVNVDLDTHGTYQLAVVNYMGQVMYKSELKYDGSKSSLEISPGSTLPPGIYAVVLSGNGLRLSCQILVR